MGKQILFILTFIISSIGYGSNPYKNTSSLLVPLSGNYTIPGDFASINDAAFSLNLNGISGPVVFNVAANHTEIAPTGTSAVIPGGIVFGNIVGTTTVNTITFQKNGVGLNPIIYGGNNHFAGGIMDAIVRIIGTDYLTFESINLQENPLNTNSTIASNNMTEIGFGFFYSGTAATANGAQNNTISNCNITLNNSGINYQNTFGIYSSTVNTSTNGVTASSITAFTGSNSFNRLYGNTITNSNFGIVVIGSNTPAAMDLGWDIGGNSTLTGNTITNFGFGNGTATSAYQKLGLTVQGILINQIADNNISYNALSSINGTFTSTLSVCGIVMGFSGTMVQPGTNTSTCNYNTININNNFSENSYGIWSRIGNAASSKTINYNTISIVNTSTTVVINKSTKGIFQEVATGTFVSSSNSISINYENIDHTHTVFYIQNDVTNSILREINDNILITPVGKNLRTSGVVYGISHNGLSSGILNINNNTISINKGNVSSTSNFIGVYSNSASNTSIYEINENIITLRNSSTSNGATAISGIYTNDGVNTFSKNINLNTITIIGSNTGGTTTGITIGKANVSNCNNNSISISNYAVSIYGIYTISPIITSIINDNVIFINPTSVANTMTIYGVYNSSGTPTITNNNITINSAANPIALIGNSIVGIVNNQNNAVITTNNINITALNTVSSFIVNYTTNGISNSGLNASISNNTAIDINVNTAAGTSHTNGIFNTGFLTTISLNSVLINANSSSVSTIQGISNSGNDCFILSNSNLQITHTCLGNASINVINNTGTNTSISSNTNLIANANASTGSGRAYGINNTGTGTTINLNSIFNINSSSISNVSSSRGINSTVVSTISNNTLNHIYANAGTNSSVMGINSIGIINNNTINVSSNAISGIDSSSGIQSSSNSTVNGNSIVTNFISNEGTAIAFGINSTNQNSIISNNTIDFTAASNGNQSTLQTWFGMMYGIRSSGINTTIENNTISRVHGSMGRGTTIFEIAGILLESAENNTINKNIISNISCNGTIDNRTYLSGIYALTNSFNATIKNNRIFNISFNSSITAPHPGPGFAAGQPIPANTNGIWVRFDLNTVVNTYKIYNNHISKLYNPSSSTIGAIFGLTLSSREMNYLVYHNTILIGDNSTMVTSNITGNFGASAVGFINRIGSGTTDLRNNILYVNVMPKSTGYVSALSAIKNHDLDLATFFTTPGQTGVRPPNYNPNSNNNLFYAPSVHNRRSYFYCEGNGFGTEYNRFNIDHNTVTINDPNINVSPFSGCTSLYKTLMNGGSNNFGTDSNSYYDNVTLIEGTGTNEGYWTPTGETYAEMGAQILGGEYDEDSVTVLRGSNPDMGAIQFSGIIDTEPLITYNPIVPGSCGGFSSTITLNNVHIVDLAGIPTSGTLVPRLYYKVNSGAYVSVPGTLVSGNGFDGYWDFTLTGLAVGTISYYVIAQDRLTKITSNPSTGLVACNVNNVTTHPTSPSTFTMGGTTAIYSAGAWSSPPTIAKAVIFDDNFNSTINIEACSVLVKNGRNVVFNSAHSLLVQNEVVVEPGANLTFENNSSLVQIANAINSGNINYKRTATVKKFDYVYWSSPVDNFNINNLNISLPTGPKFKWNPTIANPNGGIGNWIDANGNIMETARGYIARSPESFNPSLTTPFTSTFIGVPNNGSINYTISRGPITTASLGTYTSVNGAAFTEFDDNFNLIGNPYPSAISANHFLYQNRESSGGNLAGFIKVWMHGIDPSNSILNPFYGSFNYNYDPNDYLTYNILGASCCPAVGDYKIGAGQGFFVQMIEGIAASGTVNFDNSMRRDGSNVIHNNTTFFRNNITNNTPVEKHRIWLDVVDNSNQNSSRTLIGYTNEATNGYDSFFDATSGYQQTLDIYSIIDSAIFDIQGRILPFNNNDVVPIGVTCPNDGNYSIAIAALDGLFENQNIYIKDLELDIIHNLKSNPYSFSSLKGTINSRFIIIYENSPLNNNTFEISNEVKLINVNNKIIIKSTRELLKNINIFDTCSRLLFTYKEINNYDLTIPNIQNNQIYIVEITTESGKKIIKKTLN